VRQPAAFCGVVGLKPTWGAVSRFGLVAYASSLEQIGVLSKDVALCRQVFSIIKGADPYDQSSRDAAGRQGTVSTTGKIAVLKTEPGVLSPEVLEGYLKAQKNLVSLGFKLSEIDIPALKYVVPAYYTIATAEASANLARYDGIRYGARPPYAENPEELVCLTREAGFGPEVKLRILLGTFVLRSGFQDRFYLTAQKIRAGIKRSFESIVGTESETGPYDAILMPVFPTQAFGRGEKSLSDFAQKAADIYTCCANLAGLPALAFPASLENGLPVGVQLIGRSFSEELLFDIAAPLPGFKLPLPGFKLGAR
jgi:aspartyl-tRNA(Asn)/glutamyl-tRNA(Gln) amidotransferase subunit A